MKCDTCKKITKPKRSTQQNRALHLWFTQLAETLSNAGFDIQATLNQDIDVPWSATTIKELLWRPVQKIYKRVNSTTKLSTEDINNIYDIINREIGQRTGIDVPPFPSVETLMEIDNYERT